MQSLLTEREHELTSECESSFLRSRLQARENVLWTWAADLWKCIMPYIGLNSVVNRCTD